VRDFGERDVERVPSLTRSLGVALPCPRGAVRYGARVIAPDVRFRNARGGLRFYPQNGIYAATPQASGPPSARGFSPELLPLSLAMLLRSLSP
jgi:hypothetical protein